MKRFKIDCLDVRVYKSKVVFYSNYENKVPVIVNSGSTKQNIIKILDYIKKMYIDMELDNAYVRAGNYTFANELIEEIEQQFRDILVDYIHKQELIKNKPQKINVKLKKDVINDMKVIAFKNHISLDTYIESIHKLFACIYWVNEDVFCNHFL